MTFTIGDNDITFSVDGIRLKQNIKVVRVLMKCCMIVACMTYNLCDFNVEKSRYVT